MKLISIEGTEMCTEGEHYLEAGEEKRRLIILPREDNLILHIQDMDASEGMTIVIPMKDFVEALVPLEEDHDKTPEGS